MNDKIIVLHITSFSGYCPGAVHCYGALHSRKNRIELKQKVTKENEQSLSSSSYKYRIGTTTERFLSENDVRKVAKKQWKKHFPDAVLLLEGTPACGDPQKCLCGPKDLKMKINRLKDKGEKIGWYEGDEKRMNMISDKYWMLLKKKSTLVTAPTTKVVGFCGSLPQQPPYGEALALHQTPARVSKVGIYD